MGQMSLPSELLSDLLDTGDGNDHLIIVSPSTHPRFILRGINYSFLTASNIPENIFGKAPGLNQHQKTLMFRTSREKSLEGN